MLSFRSTIFNGLALALAVIYCSKDFLFPPCMTFCLFCLVLTPPPPPILTVWIVSPSCRLKSYAIRVAKNVLPKKPINIGHLVEFNDDGLGKYFACVRDKKGSSLLGQSMHRRWSNAISRKQHKRFLFSCPEEHFDDRSAFDDDIFCQIRTPSISNVIARWWSCTFSVSEHLRRKSSRKTMHISLFQDRQPRWLVDWRDLGIEKERLKKNKRGKTYDNQMVRQMCRHSPANCRIANWTGCTVIRRRRQTGPVRCTWLHHHLHQIKNRAKRKKCC